MRWFSAPSSTAKSSTRPAKDSTTGKPLPLGKRGAWAADHVAGDDQPDRKDAPSMAEATPEAPTVEEDTGAKGGR